MCSLYEDPEMLETPDPSKLANKANIKPIASFLASEVMDLNGSAMSRRTARVFSHHRGSVISFRYTALCPASSSFAQAEGDAARGQFTPLPDNRAE